MFLHKFLHESQMICNKCFFTLINQIFIEIKVFFLYSNSFSVVWKKSLVNKNYVLLDIPKNITKIKLMI